MMFLLSSSPNASTKRRILTSSTLRGCGACGMAPLAVKMFVLLSLDKRQKRNIDAGVIELEGEEKLIERIERLGRLI